MADMFLRETDPSEFKDEIAAEVETRLRKALAERSQPRLVDRAELAGLLGVSVQTVTRLAKDGVIPSIRIGSRRLFEARKVIDALANARDEQVSDPSPRST